MVRGFFAACFAVALLCACTDDGQSTGSSTTSTGSGGSGGQAATSLDAILQDLRSDRDAALLAHASESGWPVAVDGGYLFVCTDLNLSLIAGDHDAWAGTPMTQDSGFYWIVLPVAQDSRYKFTNLTDWVADPWARSYTYDEFGEMSLVLPKAKHLDRYFAVGDAAMQPRTVRVWVPEGGYNRVLYVHDGQNLFDPQAPWGGWHLQDSVPSSMLVVGIDNTPARIDEYTHVQDQIQAGSSFVGGKGDAYADFIQTTVRPLIQTRYGELGPIGVMGSSLGGLISLAIADRYPGDYAFAASLSGTVGWGSIGAGVTNETILQRYASHGHQAPVVYLDSGGNGSCFDGDGDGIEDDDPTASDNFCENLQMRGTLTNIQYVEDVDLYYWWDTDADHNEAAWAARVFRPLQIFATL